MKTQNSVSGFSRWLLVIFSVALVSCTFLFAPLGGSSSSRDTANLYEQYLAGTASGANGLNADELPPKRKMLSVPEIHPTPVSLTVEAETLSVRNPVTVLTERSGYSGEGYIGTLPDNSEAAVTVPLHIRATQHYDITLCAAAKKECENALCINGNMISQFSLEGSDTFTKITFYGIFLEEGDNTLTIDGIDGGLDLDYIMLCNDTSEYRPDFKVAESLCNPDADAETQRLYAFLRDQWGKTILTGQYASDGSNPELNLIYRITGQLPAIRFGMLGTGDDRAQTDAAIDWSVYTHGIVGLMWQWNAPGTDSVYTDETDFRLYSALLRKDPASVAKLTPEQAAAAVECGALSKEAQMLLQDIDTVAESLKKLDQMHIPVLWRPLHEAGGGWYWWGASGREAYQKLWSLLWHRLTDYHQLNNLIWVWNGQSAAYLVPESTYDIAALDVYLQPRMAFGSRYEQFISLARITDSKKLLALSECSTLPDPEMMKLDESVWLFFGLWYGDYLMKPDGSFNDANYSSSDLYNLYNSELALSLNDFLSVYE